MSAKRSRTRNLLNLLGQYASKKEFAEAAGLSPAHVSQMANSVRAMGDAVARRIEQALGLDPGWMDLPHEDKEATLIGYPIRGRAPLLSWTQAREWQTVVDNLQPPEGKEWVETTVPIRRHTYALEVRGDSMEPLFPAGIAVVVEPELEPQVGDYVVVDGGDEGALLRQLVREGGEWYLKPLNRGYAVKPVPEGAMICGVVREAVRRFR